MSTEDFWRHFNSLYALSPWLVVLVCAALLALPLSLMLIGKIPLFARAARRHPWIGSVSFASSAVFIQIYYWTIGFASILMLIAMFFLMLVSSFR